MTGLPYSTLLGRSPKGGGGGKGSSTSSGGHKTYGAGYHGGGGGGSGHSNLPAWAIAVIIVCVLWLCLFISLAVHFSKKDSARNGQVNIGRVLWKAFRYSTGIQIFIWTYRTLSSSSSSSPTSAFRRHGSSYNKLEGGEYEPQHQNPSGTEPPPGPPAYTGAAAVVDKYEPLGYSAPAPPPPTAQYAEYGYGYNSSSSSPSGPTPGTYEGYYRPPPPRSPVPSYHGPSSEGR
ncbi:hypothetical protein F5Y15DRAFT_181143 [Xylariaceae sp. FL0016]|nr:hypothetical protein F5Y15DRAFT_181143 [Xylariaceae sp. FL0016]